MQGKQNTMKKLIAVGLALCAAGFVYAGTSVVIDHQTIETNAWSQTLGTVSELRIVDSTIHATNNFTIADSTQVRHQLLTVAVTNSTLTSDGVQTGSGSAYFNITGISYSGNTVDVSVAGSTINARKTSFNIGTWSPNKGWGEEQFFYFTNTTLNLSQLQARGQMSATFDDCTLNFVNGPDVAGGFGSGSSYGGQKVLFKNSTIVDWPLSLGAYISDDAGEVTISGGTTTFSRMKFGANAPGLLTLTDGVNATLDNLDVTAQNRWQFPSAANAKAELRITNGAKLNFVSPTANPTIYVGYNGSSADKPTIIRIDNGGMWDDAGWGEKGSLVYFGYGTSSAELYVGENGTFKTYSFSIGYSGGASTPHRAYVYQTGGLVRICRNSTDEQYGAVQLAPQYAEGKDCRYYLNGGVLMTPQIYGSLSAHWRDASKNCWTTFSANGGTLKPGYNSTKYNLVSALDTAEVGPKGLTVDCYRSAGAIINQEFTNIEGEEGLFRKIGAYTLTLKFPHRSTWNVTETRVEEGELVISGGEESMVTTLVVTNGATLSLAGDATKLTLDALDVNGATLKFDPGDQIVVTNGAANLSNITLAFATALTNPVTNDLLVVDEPLSEESVSALRIAANNMTVPAGMAGRATVETSGGKTTVRITVDAGSAPLTATTTWKGATADLWGDAANGWTDGVPTKDLVAAFPASDAVSKSVTVPEGAKAGALSFADGYTLSGSTLAMPSPRGALEIETEAGTTEIAAPIDLADEAAVTTAAGSELKLSGNVTYGGITKEGTGKLVLSGANHFEYGITSDAGMLEIAGKNALGTAQGWADADITLANDTLRFKTSDESETVTKRGIRVNTPGVYQGAVIWTDTPATVGKISSAQGAILKRGHAPLTVQVAQDFDISAKASSKSWYCQRLLLHFPEADGTGPENPGISGEDYFTGISVTEGELKFKAAPGVVLPKVSETKNTISIGIHTTNVTKRAVFSLDGVYFYAYNCDFYANGFNDGNNYISSTDRYPLNPEILRNEVRLVNGAILHVDNFYQNNYGSGSDMRPETYMTNATLRARTCLWFAHANSAKANVSANAIATYRVADSALEGTLGLSGGVDGDFANTYVGPIDHSAYGTMKFANTGFGTLLFRDGSVFRVGTLDMTSFDTRYKLTYAFDGAEWQYGAGDYTFSPANLTAGMEQYLAFEARGNGLILKPAAGTTFTAAYPIGGEGGLVLDGPGTVKFNAGMLAFTGTSELRQGTLDAGGQNVTVRIVGANAPTLRNCTVLGKTLVDMEGVACAAGDVITVANLSGTTTADGGFKAVNIPEGLRATFAIEDGQVKMTVSKKRGLVITIR